jgi:hypothetical protein
VEELLVNLVSKARSLGIRIVVSFQTPTGRDTRWRSNLSTVLAGALQAGSQDEPALSIAVKDLRYRPSALPPPQQQPGVFVCRAAGAQHLVRAPYLSNDAFDRQCATLPAKPAPVKAFPASDDALLASLLGGTELPESGNLVAPSYLRVTASSREVTALPDTELPALTGAEIALVTRLLVTGSTPTQVAKRLPGYSPRLYKVFKAKVDAVAAMLASGDTKPLATDDLDAPGGPALPDAFNF